ncbi:hypothetical protein [Streptomyces hokutonensis]|uniref:Secreted protein n=1 Tax=Streptomyces hokutonensis TaxID=1306990 RepID=A0ABW6MB51_9ACTN
MSTLALLVILLLALVCAVIFAGLAYAVYRHPALGQPLAVAFGAVTLIAMAVTAILSR